MIDESKLIFYTGAPGSKWSAAAHLITKNTKYKINTSDYREDRFYKHEDVGVAHHGAYWGPGNGVGENFHRLSELTKEEILKEIDSPYEDNNWEQYRLIKCHHFSMHLDFIKDTFPKSKILVILRPDLQCFKGWIGAGGFEGITYPNYTVYYKDKETIEKKIEEENNSAKTFIHNHNLDLHVIREKYWKEFWGISRDSEETDTYMKSIEMRQSRGKIRWNFDALIAHYNF
jgi:hypothetical protein